MPISPGVEILISQRSEKCVEQLSKESLVSSKKVIQFAKLHLNKLQNLSREMLFRQMRSKWRRLTVTDTSPKYQER